MPVDFQIKSFKESIKYACEIFSIVEENPAKWNGDISQMYSTQKIILPWGIIEVSRLMNKVSKLSISTKYSDTITIRPGIYCRIKNILLEYLVYEDKFTLRKINQYHKSYDYSVIAADLNINPNFTELTTEELTVLILSF